MNPELFKLITPNSTLLTPNRRLAAVWLNQYNQFQLSQNDSSWQTLDILPLSSWLQRLWHDCLAKTIGTNTFPLLLSKNQESILWEMILRRSPASDSLLQITDTAALAMAAWELLKLWQIKPDHPDLALTADGQVFQQWAQEFKKICRQHHWLDPNSIADVIQLHLAKKDINPPTQIILLGFTEVAPQHQALLSLCEQLGTEVIHHSASHNARTLQKIGLADEETEIRIMARWAKATYEAQTEKPAQSIACVIPRLESLRDLVLQIFCDVFSENSTFTLDHTLLPFNISAGKSLLSFPVVQAALDLLKLQQENISIDTFSCILHSPFLGEAEQEQSKRSYFDSRLRQANLNTFSLSQLLQPNTSYCLSRWCPALAKRLQKYVNYVADLKQKHPIRAWVKTFVNLLTQLGWPGERSLNSAEFQVVQRWLELLDEYASFDILLEPQNCAQALHYLIQLSANTVFQIQSPNASIHILGVLEAVEQPFEHLWVMGLDDNHWPALPKPNPLIPQHLQKIWQMPHATSERELAYCKKLLQQLKQSANHIIFSYPNQQEDIELRPSTLLKDITSLSAEDLLLSDFIPPAQLIFSQKNLELFVDEIAPPIQAHETIQGGTRIFKLQAACPFKAFAELRLHATGLETPTVGLREMDRGTLTHTALEFIWKILGDSQTLLSLSEPELQKIIHDAAEYAIQLELPNESTMHRYFLLELQRLEKLIASWLQLEMQRPAFKVIWQEHEITLTIGDREFSLRIDRMDELADGSHLIIDYKTGKNAEIKNWFGSRPDEPQLPLYALAQDEKTVGIAFGQLHPDDLSLIGISKKNLDIKTIKTLAEVSFAQTTLWEQQLQEWRLIMENLSHAFQQGMAKVDPKDIHSTCKYCKLQTLCRIHEK